MLAIKYKPSSFTKIYLERCLVLQTINNRFGSIIVTTGVQLITSPIAQGYRKLCGAIQIFAFVAMLAIRKVTFQDHAERNIKNMIS